MAVLIPLSPRAQAIFDAGREQRRIKADTFAASGTLGDDVQRRMRRAAFFEMQVMLDQQEAARLAHAEERAERNIAFMNPATPAGDARAALPEPMARASNNPMPGVDALLTSIITGKAA